MSDAPSILAADDEPQLLRLIERALTREGYGTVLAPDGSTAIRHAEDPTAQIDLALLDAAIEPAGALPILEALARRKESVSIVLMSGDFLSHEEEEALELHGGTFLRKPFALRALLELLESRLRNPTGPTRGRT